MAGWNPWHGCHRISEGCRHCYVFRMDSRYGRIPDTVRKNREFTLPIQKNRDGSYKIPAGEVVYTCFTSDFFLEDADAWREEAWRMIARRQDLHFFMITKRIHRLSQCVPQDWGEGYPNVTICCTVENQDRADFRLPIYREAPICHKQLVCSPLLGPIDLSDYLGDWVEQLTVGGESGNEARLCRYEWVLDLRRQCMLRGIPFRFMQTGARFERDGRIFRVPRKFQHSQAKKAGLDYL
ncbi:MAG TPA: hypothetical protein DCR31_01860 [Ruminococcaceae bacterium]|nr:hypothetical protein [Oscillospiraceae bacterium]